MKGAALIKIISLSVFIILLSGVVLSNSDLDKGNGPSLNVLNAFSNMFSQKTPFSGDSQEFGNKIVNETKKKYEEDGSSSQRVLIKIKEGSKDMLKSKIDTSQLTFETNDKEILSVELDELNMLKILDDPNVLEIWPDRVTYSFLDKSVYQIHADTFWNLSYNGSGIKIAILDTGVDADHPMLQGRIVLQQDFTGEGFDDVYGHGTHVAGIAAGHDENYTGVAPGAIIYNGKVLDNSGNGYLSWLINGIDWAMDPDGNPLTDDGADIISLSLGATYSGNPEDLLNAPEVEKVREAISKGIVVVIASGNCGSGCNGFYGVTTPGITPEAITVGAVDDNNDWAYFSSGGIVNGTVKPDIVAPGVSICSSVPTGYACYSGTSMATPHVSGAVALLLQKDNTLNPVQVKDILKSTALDLGDAGEDTKYGAGLINMKNAYFYSTNQSLLPHIDNVNVIANLAGETSYIIADVSDSNITYLTINNANVANFTGDVNYPFEPDQGHYDFEIYSENEFGTDTFSGEFDVTNYQIEIPNLVLGQANNITFTYTGNKKENKIKDLYITMSYDEFESAIINQKDIKISSDKPETAIFEMTPNLVGTYRLIFTFDNQTVIKEAVSYGQMQGMIQPIQMWVRG